MRVVFNSSGPGNHFTNLVNEVVVAENSRLDFYSIQNDNGNRYQFAANDVYFPGVGENCTNRRRFVTKR